MTEQQNTKPTENEKCPHCGETNKPCSTVNSLSRAWARGACAKKNNK